jgi:predicted nucleic acid-binding protein
MSTKLVIDASVLVKWIRQEKEDHLPQAESILNDLKENRVSLYAPELAKYEVGNVLVKRKLSLADARVSLATLSAIPIRYIAETRETSLRSYEIADNLGITYYDAAYISLTEAIGGILVTDNVKHHGKAKEVKVIPLSEYK